MTREVETTRATVEALGLLSAQSSPILVHSNLDDGYAAWFKDMASALGFAMIEKWVVEELCGLQLGHCWGHTFTDPVKRLAFKTALETVNPTPGTMIYGNTTLYGPIDAANYGALAGYLTVDIVGQLISPTGHAITPIPVTEAQRIPTPDEVIEVHQAAHRLAERLEESLPLFSTEAAEELSAPLLARGRVFADRIKEALSESGVDMSDPAQILHTIKMTGPAKLEAFFALPFDSSPEAVESPFVDEISQLSARVLSRTTVTKATFEDKPIRVLIASTDVHFYGKSLLETVLASLNIDLVDGGVSAEPSVLAQRAVEAQVSAIGISTYNGIALSFAQKLRGALAKQGLSIPVYIGGRLNEIMTDADSPLPVEVHQEIAQVGVIPCQTVEEMLEALAENANGRPV